MLSYDYVITAKSKQYPFDPLKFNIASAVFLFRMASMNLTSVVRVEWITARKTSKRCEADMDAKNKISINLSDERLPVLGRLEARHQDYDDGDVVSKAPSCPVDCLIADRRARTHP